MDRTASKKQKRDIGSMVITNCKENKCETAALQEIC